MKDVIKSITKGLYHEIKPELPYGNYFMHGKELWHKRWGGLFYMSLDTVEERISVNIDPASTTPLIVCGIDFAKKIAEKLSIPIEVEKIKSPRTLVAIDSLYANEVLKIKIESNYTGYPSETIRDIEKVYEGLQVFCEHIKGLKTEIQEFVEEYNRYVQRISEIAPEIKEPEEEEHKETEIIEECKRLSDKYKGVWYPIYNDKQLLAVIHKVIR